MNPQGIEPGICANTELWRACAGSTVKLPQLHSKVFYFPQGHAENACGNVDFDDLRIPASIPCQVSAFKYMVDAETDEVYAKLTLIPSADNEISYIDDGASCSADVDEEPHSFSNRLSPSDVNTGGSCIVPHKCADFIFPKLDYSHHPPVQQLQMTDLHGEVWTFIHIYRGDPKRHLFTTGWRDFVIRKKPMANDSLVFMKAENGELSVGIRRAKKGIAYANRWNPVGGNCESPFQGYRDAFVRRYIHEADFEREVRAEKVIEAAKFAAKGQTFEVVYYPRASRPEFCVKDSAVVKAIQVQWCEGIRVKTAFEDEDSSRISWFMGTVSSVQVADPIHWPNSPWRLLQVEWDEPVLLHNVKSVSPWWVELVSNVPAVHRSPFSSPRKRPRFSSNPDGLLSYLPEDIPTSLQGAGQSRFALTLPDHHFIRPQLGLCPVNYNMPLETPSNMMEDNKPTSVEKPASSSIGSGSGLGSGSGINPNGPPGNLLDDRYDCKVPIESDDSSRSKRNP